MIDLMRITTVYLIRKEIDGVLVRSERTIDLLDEYSTWYKWCYCSGFPDQRYIVEKVEKNAAFEFLSEYGNIFIKIEAIE